MLKKLFSKFTLSLGSLTGYGIIAVSKVNAETSGTGGGGRPVIISSPFDGDIVDVIERVIGFLVAVAIPITVVMILIGAFQMLVAGGSPEKFRNGTKTITYAIVGLIVVFLARGSITLIKQLVGQ